MVKDVNVDSEINENQELLDDNNEKFEDELGGFDKTKKANPKGLKAFILIMAIIVILLMGFMVYSVVSNSDTKKTSEDNTAGAEPAPQRNVEFDSTPPPDPDLIRDEEVEEMSSNESNDKPEPEDETFEVEPAGNKEEEELTPEEEAMQRRLSGFSNENNSNESKQKDSSSDSNRKSNNKSSKESNFSKKLNSEGDTNRIFASKLENPSMTVPKGTMILCGTQTELNTDQPGMVACMVSRNVYSADGKVKLIDKGAQVTGMIDSGIEQGQERVFVSWNRLRNPDNTIINLNSPGTGTLGAPGMSGHVNNHFWQRFGNSMLVSVISDFSEALFQAAQNQASRNSDTSVNLNQTSQSSQQLTREVLRHTIDIPPTLKANQGKPVVIYVANDLDFSDVYDLEMAK